MRLMKIELYVQKAMDLILSNSRKSLNARTACLFEEDLFEELYEDLLQSRHETAYKTVILGYIIVIKKNWFLI